MNNAFQTQADIFFNKKIQSNLNSHTLRILTFKQLKNADIILQLYVQYMWL